MKNKAIIGVSSLAIIGVLLSGGLALAQGNTPGQGFARGMRIGNGQGQFDRNKNAGVFGTVTAISGNSLTVTAKQGFNSTTTTIYTVDATNAKVTKAGASSVVSSIVVGDTVIIQGTVSGTNVVATAIRDGVMSKVKDAKEKIAEANPIIKGNGQPVVGGKVTAVSGNTLTIITSQGNITYTIDASSAVITKGNVASSITNIAVGDEIIAQGATNGTTVVASSVIDQTKVASPANIAPKAKGFFGSIGNFFHSLFGF